MVLQGTFIFEFCITIGACIRSYLIMNRYFVSVETAYFEECLVTILTFVELFLIMNFPNVSLEPVGLRKYFPTMTAFICRTLCFWIHFRDCSRWWRHTPSVLLVSTVQVIIFWLWLWTGISLCPIGLVTLNPANVLILITSNTDNIDCTWSQGA